ncbi:MAG: hypothetical protein AB7I18_11275 [Candidatus Berkiella sp.]
MSKKNSSWVNNLTTWFQTIRSQDRDAPANQPNSPDPTSKTEYLSRRVLDIMNKSREENPTTDLPSKPKR